jgi:hypothetical protein
MRLLQIGNMFIRKGDIPMANIAKNDNADEEQNSIRPNVQRSWLTFAGYGGLTGLFASIIAGGIYRATNPGQGYDTATWALVGALNCACPGLLAGALIGGIAGILWQKWAK